MSSPRCSYPPLHFSGGYGGIAGYALPKMIYLDDITGRHRFWFSGMRACVDLDRAPRLAAPINCPTSAAELDSVRLDVAPGIGLGHPQPRGCGERRASGQVRSTCRVPRDAARSCPQVRSRSSMRKCRVASPRARRFSQVSGQLQSSPSVLAPFARHVVHMSLCPGLTASTLMTCRR